MCRAETGRTGSLYKVLKWICFGSFPMQFSFELKFKSELELPFNLEKQTKNLQKKKKKKGH
jgi:hypothetical protein